MITEKGNFVDVELYREYTSVQEKGEVYLGKKQIDILIVFLFGAKN